MAESALQRFGHLFEPKAYIQNKENKSSYKEPLNVVL